MRLCNQLTKGNTMRIQGKAYDDLKAGIESILARGLNSPRFKSETLKDVYDHTSKVVLERGICKNIKSVHWRYYSLWDGRHDWIDQNRDFKDDHITTALAHICANL